MGLLGAAFGLGFIFGPLLGGLLGLIGEKIGSEPPFGLSFAALGAAALCFMNAGLASAVLKESLSPEIRAMPKPRRHRMQELFKHLSRPIAGPLMIVFFLGGLAMAQMEAMLFPYMADEFGWDLRTSSYGFAYIGVLMVITQGVIVRRMMPAIGERKTLAIGLACFAVTLAAIPVWHSIAMLGAIMTVLAIGNGLMRPPNLGLISLATPADSQGEAMGVTNSLASLGRVLGPVIGGFFYERLSHGAPFFFAGTLTAAAFGLALVETKKLKSS